MTRSMVCLAHTQMLIITKQGSEFYWRFSFLPGMQKNPNLFPEKTLGKSDFTP